MSGDRVRAMRVPRPEGDGYEIALYLDSTPPKPFAYIPMINAPTLANDLFIAVKGETVARQEKAS